MPTLVLRRRSHSGDGTAEGSSAERRAVAVPDQVVSAVPAPVVSSAAATGTPNFPVSSTKHQRYLPKGVRPISSGKFIAKTKWGGKSRYVGTFDTPEQASAAYVSIKNDLATAKVSLCGTDEEDAMFDAAETKALEAIGGSVSTKKKKSKAASEGGLPRGVQKKPSGKFVAKKIWGGKKRYVGTFDTPEKAERSENNAMDDDANVAMDDGAPAERSDDNAMDDDANVVIDDGAPAERSDDNAMDDDANVVIDDGAPAERSDDNAMDDDANVVIDDGAPAERSDDNAMDDDANVVMNDVSEISQPVSDTEMKRIVQQWNDEHLRSLGLVCKFTTCNSMSVHSARFEYPSFIGMDHFIREKNLYFGIFVGTRKLLKNAENATSMNDSLTAAFGLFSRDLEKDGKATIRSLLKSFLVMLAYCIAGNCTNVPTCDSFNSESNETKIVFNYYQLIQLIPVSLRECTPDKYCNLVLILQNASRLKKNFKDGQKMLLSEVFELFGITMSKTLAKGVY